MQISKQTFKNAESRFSKNSFARKRISNRYNTRRKIDNTSTILKTPTLKSVSELRNYCNPKFFNVDEILNFLYQFLKNDLPDEDLPYMDKYEFTHYLIGVLDKLYDEWKLFYCQDFKRPRLIICEMNDASATGHCAELNWITEIKVELRDLVIDTLNYFWKEYDIPILHNLEYYIEIAKEELWENVQEFDEKERKLHTESLKFYEKDVMSYYNRICDNNTNVNFADLLSKVKGYKCKNFKEQKVIEWLKNGLFKVNENFNQYIAFDIIEDNDEAMFGPQLYCNFVWSIEEDDLVWHANDQEVQMYYQNYEIVPFCTTSYIDKENIILRQKSSFPTDYIDWLDESWLISEK